MSCAAFTRALPPPTNVVTVTKHRAGPAGPTMTYMNVKMIGKTEAESGGKLTPAQQYVSRSGGIIDSAQDYYIGVSRLRFSLNVPFIIAPPNFVGGVWDRAVGETAWSFSVGYVNPANPTAFVGTAFIKIPPPQRLPGTFTSPPTDYSCAFQTMSDWILALNTAASAAFAACVAAAAAAPVPVPATVRAPFFSVADPGSGRMKLTMFPFNRWAVITDTDDPQFTLDINADAIPAFSGWDLFGGTGADQLPEDPNFKAISDGYNFSPPNAAGSESLTPTTPATAALIIQQNSPSFDVPGIVRLSILSTLPVNPEYSSAAVDGKGTELVLTDFSITTGDVIGSNRDVYTYDSQGTAGTRWLKLVGGGNTITEFSIRATTTDWQGIVRPFYLRGPADVVDVKLVFAPVDVIEG